MSLTYELPLRDLASSQPRGTRAAGVSVPWPLGHTALRPPSAGLWHTPLLLPLQRQLLRPELPDWHHTLHLPAGSLR